MIQSAAKEAFLVLRSYDYNVVMYDDEGGRVYEPEEARRLYASEGIMVGIMEAGEDSVIKLAIGPSIPVGSVKGLSDTLRNTAVKFNMLFNLTRTARDMSAKEFASALGEGKGDNSMNYLIEGMYGTSKSSYLKLENAKMIVRHSKKVDETVRGSRARNIDKIFIENAHGERFMFPTNSLPPARAMTQHINQGGAFADQVGAQIARMAQDFGELSMGVSYIDQNAGALMESAVELSEKLVECRRAMRETFRRLSSPRFYESEAEKIANPIINEADLEDNLSEDDVISMLAVEGKELSEGVVSAIVEAMRGKPFKYEKKSLKEEDNIVKVLQQEIPAIEWEKLKSGEVELVVEVQPVADTAKTVELLLAEKLNAVINAMSDSDASFRVLSVAHSIITSEEDEPNRAAALKLADIVVKKNYPKTKLSKDLNEFANWINNTSVSNRLMEASVEDQFFMPEALEDKITAAVDATPFDVDGFLEADVNTAFHPDGPEVHVDDKTYKASDLLRDMYGYYFDEVCKDHDLDYDTVSSFLGNDIAKVEDALPEVIKRYEDATHIIIDDLAESDETDALDLETDLEIEGNATKDFENEILAKVDTRLPRY